METTEIIKTENNPQSLIQLAIESKLPIEHLERLMALKEKFDLNEAKKKFLSAMANFQSECPPLEKTKKVAFGNTKYQYAPLGEITATIKPALKANDLSFRWELDDSTDKIICTFIVSHKDGHSERSTMSSPKDTSGSKNEIQSRGSTITYLQRYTLIAGFGLSTADEDTDMAEATPEQYMVIERYKNNSILDQSKLDKLEQRLQAGLTHQQATECIEYLKQNQKDNIASGGNFSQTDIKNKQKQHS